MAAENTGYGYEQMYPGLMQVAYCLTGSNDAAEDLVQETYARCLNRLPTVRDPEFYLRAALVNNFRSALRRKEVSGRHTFPSYDDGILPSAMVEFRDVLLRLPDRQRSAVVLRYIADLDDDTIAEILRCRRSTVRSLVKRGLEHLREELS